MNSWRYVEVLVLLLQVDHEDAFVSRQENSNSYRVDQDYDYAMAWEVQKIAYCMCSSFPPHLILEKSLPLALHQELSKIQ